MRLLIVGGTGGTNIGASLLEAAIGRRIEARLADHGAAYAGSPLRKLIAWHLGGHTPARLEEFSTMAEAEARAFGASVLLTTGLAPMTAASLERLGKRGVRRINYLTDDPFNPLHATRWFDKALAHYDHIFSPRAAGMDELAQRGARVSYLPFGYDAAHFHPDQEVPALRSEVFFAGNGDKDRAPYILPMLDAGINVRLHGDYWPKYLGRKVDGGHATPDIVRKGLSSTKVGLCLVRRANRDGNSMRTFEVPAVGACPLMEDTEDHRRIFGDTAAYFSTPADALEKARLLLGDDGLRTRLAREAHARIVAGRNTYGDRLDSMLAAVD